jgi:hypothetical protein
MRKLEENHGGQLALIFSTIPTHLQAVTRIETEEVDVEGGERKEM